jgi:parvulin-like peptidyl-prolyl isomerase
MAAIGVILIMAATSTIVQGATLIDRIAILVGNSVIKDSDIDRDIRITDFLNRDPLEFSPAARKRAADRLVNQALIRREIEVAQYPYAADQDVDSFLQQIRKQRFKSDAEYRHALEEYGISEAQLRRALKWQLTVLHFIDMRFRPGVLITDQEMSEYYNSHLAALTRENGGKQPNLEEARAKIEDLLAGQRVNQQFEAWLDETRKNANVQYREASLQ